MKFYQNKDQKGKDMKKIVAIVPMKLNNQRLPQKNTKAFTNGKPLCYYILSTLLKIEKIDEVYVYCSNEGIKKYIPSGVKYLKRSESLDQNTTKMNEVLKAFAKDVPADVYVMTHTTAPFISKESIEKGLDAVLSGEYDSSFAAKKLQDFLWKDGKPFNYELDNILVTVKEFICLNLPSLSSGNSLIKEFVCRFRMLHFC